MAGEIAQAVQDAEKVTPYIYEILVVAVILTSLGITQLTKKIRWFPSWMCKLKPVKPRGEDEPVKYYKKLKTGYLDMEALLLTWAGSTYCLIQRYDKIEFIIFVCFMIAFLQRKIIKTIFIKMKQEGHEKMAAALAGELYVGADATVFDKTLARMSGGGIDKRDKKK